MRTNSKFLNVIVCEDIRDEVGNKKSLMGVIGGDIIVSALPATIQIAIYMEYQPDDEDGKSLNITFRLLHDDTQIAEGKMLAPIEHGKAATLILPRGLIVFEKAAVFRVVASINGRPEEEIINKNIGPKPTS